MNALNRYVDKSFLIIDDFAEFRSSLKNILISIGANDIDIAVNADSGLEQYQQKHHDVVLCDYNLGDDSKDGQQLLEELNYREILRKDSIFIMVTAENSMEMVMGAIEYSPDDYLTKPFTKQTLRTRLDRVYQKKTALNSVLTELNKQKHESAVNECNELIKARSKYTVTCLRIKGDCMLRLGLYTKAKKIYDTVLQQREIIWALMGRGKSWLGLGQYELAISDFDKIININHSAVSAYDLKAEAFIALGEKQKALETLDQACKISPKSISRFRLHGDLSVDLTQFDKALISYKKVLSLGKNSVVLKEEDQLHYFNALIKSLATATGSQQTKLTAEFNQNLLQQKKLNKENQQFLICLNLIKATYCIEVDKEAELAQTVSDIAIQLTKMSDSIRGFLRDQLIHSKSHYPQIIESSKSISDFCVSNSVNENKALNILWANEQFIKGLKAEQKKQNLEAIKIISEAYQAADFNLTIALKLMTLIIQEFEAGAPADKYMQLFEHSVRTVKNLDPADQRFTLFRKHLKSIKTILAR
ncbi:response regulator [Catenovulum maritimum]|uniref:Response regulatory domain-containing protein n=1 Tax=Catenovulum maritimum TaxID=1513271 RepID=A0A0J8GZ82_9ALTE|nr:response regulator [Catenovulum maritimum]KMT66539.1 hypothetical protein XM47_03110 [Catenovulum maritimum]